LMRNHFYMHAPWKLIDLFNIFEYLRVYQNLFEDFLFLCNLVYLFNIFVDLQAFQNNFKHFIFRLYACLVILLVFC